MYIKKLDAPMGAEVQGIDLSIPLSADDVSTLKQAHYTHKILLFRDQDITNKQFSEFSKNFGELRLHPTLPKFCDPDYPGILVLSNIEIDGKPTGLANAADRWHSDGSYTTTPGFATILHSLEVPTQGGDTLFADQVLAYEDLPNDVKKTISSLSAWHNYIRDYERMREQNPHRPILTPEALAKVQPCLVPMVIQHPTTGRRNLYVNETYTTHIEGLPQNESKDLLKFLFEHSTHKRYQYQHRWNRFDVVFWDNCSLAHRATETLPQHRRRLNRTSIKGTALQSVVDNN